MYDMNPIAMDTTVVAANLWGLFGKSFVYLFSLKIRRTSIVNAVVTPISRAFRKKARIMVVALTLNSGLNPITKHGEKILV